jgi:hypothetical protein
MIDPVRATRGLSATTIVLAIALSGALAASAYAWSWPWEQDSATSSSESSSDAPIAVPSDIAIALRSDHSGVPPTKILGTIENVDAANLRFILKIASGKYESFRLAKSALIMEHHRRLALSALKPGERVSVRCRSGSRAAVRVYVLDDRKA